MTKTLYALTAIERGPATGDGNRTPGDVFAVPEAEANRLVNLNAARYASDEDVALAEVRNRYFPDATPISQASVTKVTQAADAAADQRAAEDAADKAAAEKAAADKAAAEKAAAAGKGGKQSKTDDALV